jgi:hypothetical protein
LNVSVSLGDVIAMLVALVTSGVAWGTLRQRIINAEGRMSTLESEWGKMQVMAERLVRVETMLQTQTEFLKDLNSALRWLSSGPSRHPHDQDEPINGGIRR